MNVVLLRVGIDKGCGGMNGPLFRDGSFEFIPIPDDSGVDKRTYGNTFGRRGRKLVEYFPKSRQLNMQNQAMHVDPEFATFTYGDPTSLKAGLRRLERGDILAFYAGLRRWDFDSSDALYLIGYFEVVIAGKAMEFRTHELKRLFRANFHVRHRSVFQRDKADLVLVKGSPNSRLLERAVLISSVGRDCRGRPLHVLSPKMRKIFGDFGGKISIQRSPPRWVEARYIEHASEFVRSQN